MSLARAMRRGAALKARLGVNGIQKASRSLGTAVARADDMVLPDLFGEHDLFRKPGATFRDHAPAPCRSRRGLLPTPPVANVDRYGRQPKLIQPAEGPPAARPARPRARRDRRHAPYDRDDPR